MVSGNVSSINPIRWDQAYLDADARGMLVSKSPLDLTALTSVSGILLEGDQPAGSDRRVLLQWEGTWKRWNGTAFADAPTQMLTTESVLFEGSPVADLAALAGAQLAPLAGQQVHVAVGMMGPHGGPYPTLKVGITGQSAQATTVREEVSPEIVLSSTEAVEILSVTAGKTESSGGTVQVLISRDGAAWETDVAVKSKTARRVQIKGVLTAPTVGTSTAKLGRVDVLHRSDSGSMVATAWTSIISTTYNFAQANGSPITMEGVHLLCYRPDVPDTGVRAYVSLRPTPGVVANEVLGVGDGNSKTYTLAHPEKVPLHTLRVFWGDTLKGQGTDYAFSTSTGQITTTAPAGVEVRAAYQYGWEPETWEELSHDVAYPSARNPYQIADQFGLGALLGTGSVSSLRVDLLQRTGETTQALGTATGATQAFPLSHSAKPETIVVRATPAGGQETVLPASAWTYDPLTQVLRVSGPAGAALTVRYGWIGRQPSVDAMACVWHR